MQSYLLLGKLTLAYLFAQFPDSIDHTRTIVLPSHYASTLDEAARKLDRMQKPLFCEGNVIGRVLAVKCALHESEGFSIARDFFEKAESAGIDFHGDTARVDSPTFTGSIAYEDLIKWLHDYHCAAIDGVGVSTIKDAHGRYGIRVSLDRHGVPPQIPMWQRDSTPH